MATIPFDTHLAVKRLVKLGYKEPHAEEFVKIFQEGNGTDISNLATKNDLLALENKLIYWIIGNSLAIIAILSGLKVFG